MISSGLLALALGAGVLVTGIAITIALLREQAPEHHPPGGGTAATETPPGGLGPPLAAAVRAGDAKRIHAVACLFDLAAHGQLLFELSDADHPKALTAWSIRRLRAIAEPTPWEQVVLAAVSARPGEAVPAATAWRALRRGVGDFRNVLRDELRAGGDVDPRAGERRWPFHVVALTAALLAAGGVAVAAGLRSGIGPAAFAPAVACAVVAVIALAAASVVPRHTRQGWQRARALQAFRRYLRSQTRRKAHLDAELFERCFAYAIAFGLAMEWIHAAKRSKLPPPAWFGGSRSAAVPLAALEAQLIASGAIESRSSSAGAGAA